ncbi:MAG: LicD family protein [Lachnospiraceae bacterium]|nr:LicD family protein [Lachnospiraceae bacterium]
MIKIDDSYLEDEIRDGFYIPSMTKRTWAMELTVLDLIDSICSKHNITYFADWGTYLGAIRHKGFVPWDDDLDICMHRNELNKFLAVAKEELPEGYSVMSFHNNDYSWKFIYNIVPNDHMCFTPEYLKSHYSFPYIVAIDIFIIDNISDDDSIEQSRNEQVKRLLNEADKISLSEQSEPDKFNKMRALYDEAEKLLQLENENDTERVVQKVPWGVYHNRTYDKSDFINAVRVPFEMTSVPVPLCFNKILSSKYGNFMNIVFGGGGHNYPYYIGQKKALKEDFDYPATYKFSESDLLSNEKDYSASLKVIAAEMKEYLADSVEIIHEILLNKDSGLSYEDIITYLSELQNNIVSFGTLTESIKGEDCNTVKLLEQYLEVIYKVAKYVQKFDENKYAECDEEVKDTFASISEAIDSEIVNRRSVLFLPVKAKHFSSMRMAYEMETATPDTDVYVMPLPYYYKEYDGSFKDEMNIDTEEFIKANIPVTDYSRFDLSLLCPEKIYINSAYDEYNMAVSVDTRFYARNVKKYTEKLIYIPYFKLMEFDRANYPCWYNMQYYCTVPGVVMADKVYVQSENTRKVYIDKLNEWVGDEKYTEIWEQKIDVYDDGFEEHSEDELMDAGSKKTIVWFVSAGSLAEFGDRYIEKAYRNLDVFALSKDKLKVLLISEPFLDEMIKTYSDELYKKWTGFIDEFNRSGIGEVVSQVEDQSVEALLKANAYYGDPSYICKDFIAMKKPVMLQNVEV